MMAIEYHKRAWCCPGCGNWNAVNRRKEGNHIRPCPKCKAEVMVTVKSIARQTTVVEKEITALPMRIK